MHPKSLEEEQLVIWTMMSCVYFLLAMFIFLVQKKGWAKKRNALLGYRSIMAFRSEKTWRFANNYFFLFFFYLNVFSLLINNISFILTNNAHTAFLHSRTFFGVFLIIIILLIEVLIIIKFNWKGEPRKYWKGEPRKLGG